jgi:transcription elongation factor Elf1
LRNTVRVIWNLKIEEEGEVYDHADNFKEFSKKNRLLSGKNLEKEKLQKIYNLKKILKACSLPLEELKKTKSSQEKPVKPTKETPQTTFTCSDCNQTKPSKELSRQFANHSFCRSCSVKARKAAEKEKSPPEPKPIQFTCHSCEKNQEGTQTKMKLDQTLQEYPICSQCRPNVKEFNEADLITDELWAKYPYSSASEILEKEFGIARKEETW